MSASTGEVTGAKQAAGEVVPVTVGGATDLQPVAPGHDPGKRFRASTGIPVVPAMDGFRALAILGIVIFHLAYYTLPLRSGAARVALWGTLPNLVDALFIVSGFVVFLPTVARGGDFGSVRDYALRRGARLLPAYWLSLVVVLAMLAVWPAPLRVTPAPPFGRFPPLLEIGLHAAMLQAPAQIFDKSLLLGFGVNGPLWTLSTEITFYLVLPFVARAYFRRPWAGLALAGLVTCGWKLGILFLDRLAALVGAASTPVSLALTRLSLDGQAPAWAFSFALGMTGAWVYVRLADRSDRRSHRRGAVILQVLSVCGLAVSAYLIGHVALENRSVIAHTLGRRDPAVSMLFSASLATFMVATALAPRALQQPFARPALRSLGDISYGIYLIHLPVILFVLALAGPGHSARQFATVLLTALPVTVLYGWASARLVEQPIRRWAQRFGRRGGEVAAAAGSRA